MTQYPLTDMVRDATFSECGEYRYSLSRVWNDRGPQMTFIMLNPSVADQFHDDPTTAQCVKRVQREDYRRYGSYEAVNLFALVSTYPLNLRDHLDPVGPQNNSYLHRACGRADMVVVAWGKLGALQDRAAYVLDYILRGRPVWCLGINQDGSPKFPLRVPYKQGFVAYSPPDGH